VAEFAGVAPDGGGDAIDVDEGRDRVDEALMVVISRKTWDKLSADERKIILDGANETKLYHRLP
jgi:hypothetical protein